MLCPSRPLESPWVWPSRLKMSTSFAAKKVPHEQVGMGQDWGLQTRGAYVQGFLIEFICILDSLYAYIWGPDIDLHLESDPKLDHISSDRWHPQYQSLKCGWDTTPCGSFWKERRLEHQKLVFSCPTKLVLWSLWYKVVQKIDCWGLLAAWHKGARSSNFSATDLTAKSLQLDPASNVCHTSLAMALTVPVGAAWRWETSGRSSTTYLDGANTVKLLNT